MTITTRTIMLALGGCALLAAGGAEARTLDLRSDPSAAQAPSPVPEARDPTPTPATMGTPVPTMSTAETLAPILGGTAPEPRVVGGWSVLN